MPLHDIIIERMNNEKERLLSPGDDIVLTQGRKTDPETRKVSVIVTTFGSGGRLWDALDSLSAQDFNGTLEVIISYDRGTGTETFDVLLDWLQRNADTQAAIVMYFHNNMTLFRDREMSMKHASGNYICFLDYDNTFDATKVSEHVRIMENGGFHFTFSNQRDVNSEGIVISPEHLSVPKNYGSLKKLLFQNFVDSNTIFFDRHFYEKVMRPSLELLKDHYFDGIIEDYFYAILGSMTGNFSYIDRALGNYTYHSGNITSRLYSTNTEAEFVRIARYNERILKTLVAATIVNAEFRHVDGNIFSVFVNVISQKDMQLLAVNSGYVARGGRLYSGTVKALGMLFLKLPYIRKRLKKRSETVTR